MNLLQSPWLPLRRRSGASARLRPADLTDDYSGDPIVAVASPRPDMDGALTQMLIGLVQTAYPPESTQAWVERITQPPSPAELAEAFAPLRHAFELTGDGPRWLQDLTLEPTPKNATGLDALFIDAPGGNTLKQNKDLFVRGGQLDRLCLPCAAAALYTLQTFAPSGGAGYRTGLRGGGPLTTLAMGDTLWETVSLNVQVEKGGSALRKGGDLSQIFPWLAPTRTSEKKGGCATLPEDVSPAQVFWGMPRRVRLDLDDVVSGPCSICGEAGEGRIQRFAGQNYGVNYEGPWLHPLTPYSYQPDGSPNPRKGQPGSLLYRAYLGYASLATSERGQAAAALKHLGAVKRFLRSKRPDLAGTSRLWLHGYDMDNAKARAWIDGHKPLHTLEDPSLQAHFETEVRRCLEVAELIASTTRQQIVKVLLGDGTVRGDTGWISDRFWHDTEAAFFETLEALRAAVPDEASVTSIKERWHRSLSSTAIALFEEITQVERRIESQPRSVAEAFTNLRRFNHLKAKKVRAALGL